MLDNFLIAQIIALLKAGFATITTQVPTAPVIKQSYQPVQQGAESGPTLYLYKVSDTRLGFPQNSYVWDTNTNTEVAQTTQQYETMFQISCWATQNPANVASLTAADLANYAAYIMQTPTTVSALEATGVGIYRISQIRNQSFVDDRDRFEFAPNFDFTLTHKQIITLTAPIISETILQILDV